MLTGPGRIGYNFTVDGLGQALPAGLNRHSYLNDSLDSALRRFKRSCARSGVLAEVRKRECYEKPSVRRKKKSEAARKRKYK